jgi:hypothetical protein
MQTWAMKFGLQIWEARVELAAKIGPTRVSKNPETKVGVLTRLSASGLGVENLFLTLFQNFIPENQ